MKKIRRGLYEIECNVDLINKALLVLQNPIPVDYAEKSNSFYETSNLLNQLIKDKNDKINDCFKDFVGNKGIENLVGEKCTFLLDKKTEKIIGDLFNREKDIFSTQSTNNCVIVKMVK